MRMFLFVIVFSVVFFAVTASAQDSGFCEEGERRICGTDLGVCEPGRSICVDGIWMECNGSVGPISYEEICHNGLDDDCDGETDEGCFPWFSLVLVGTGLLFIGIGLYYMQRGKSERIISEGLSKD